MSKLCQYQPDPAVVTRMILKGKQELEGWAYCTCGRGKIVKYRVTVSLREMTIRETRDALKDIGMWAVAERGREGLANVEMNFIMYPETEVCDA